MNGTGDGDHNTPHFLNLYQGFIEERDQDRGEHHENMENWLIHIIHVLQEIGQWHIVIMDWVMDQFGLEEDFANANNVNADDQIQDNVDNMDNNDNINNDNNNVDNLFNNVNIDNDDMEENYPDNQNNQENQNLDNLSLINENIDKACGGVCVEDEVNFSQPGPSRKRLRDEEDEDAVECRCSTKVLVDSDGSSSDSDTNVPVHYEKKRKTRHLSESLVREAEEDGPSRKRSRKNDEVDTNESCKSLRLSDEPTVHPGNVTVEPSQSVAHSMCVVDADDDESADDNEKKANQSEEKEEAPPPGPSRKRRRRDDKDENPGDKKRMKRKNLK